MVPNTEFLCDVELGCSSSDGALSGREVSRHRHPPGWNQEGPAGPGKTWSSGEVLSRTASSSEVDQSNVCRPLHSGHGERILPSCFQVPMYDLLKTHKITSHF